MFAKFLELSSPYFIPAKLILYFFGKKFILVLS